MKTKKLDFSKQQFRCSSLGNLMTGTIGLTVKQKIEKKSLEERSKLTPIMEARLEELKEKEKSQELSKTCKTELIKIYNLVRFGRYEDLDNKYVKKGLEVENTSIKMLTVLEFQTTGLILIKNDKRLTHDPDFTGEVDVFTGKSIRKAEEVTDIKSKWDLLTFSKVFDEPMDPHHKLQLTGYMAITGAKRARISNVLCNTPEAMIKDQIERLKWKMGVMDPDNNDLFQEAVKKIYKNNIFDDIPLSEREFSNYIERDDDLIKEMRFRATLWRNFLMEYHAKRLNYALTRKWQSIEEVIEETL